jgi:hypothetical protein
MDGEGRILDGAETAEGFVQAGDVDRCHGPIPETSNRR